MERVRVPAEQVLHLYKPLRPGQIRGRPWLTAGMVTLYDFDRYTDAELTRKLGAAMFMTFITQEYGEQIADTGLVDDNTTAHADGTADVQMEPGLAQLLPKGMDVKFNEPADVGPNFEAFSYRKLLELCASMGLPYYAVTGDTSKANYSSLRAAMVECRRRIEQFQWEVLIYQFCRPVYQWWLPAAVLSNAIKLPAFGANPKAYSRVKWITPKWDWVDPLKDAQAEKLQVDAGFKARSDVIEAMGEDPEDTDARIAADHAREQRYGLSFPVGFAKAPDAPAGSDIAPGGSDADSKEESEPDPAVDPVQSKTGTR
jgi:lambda family phage portal protein